MFARPKFLIAGLGNPGRQYAETRHNLGFMVLDRIAERINTEFRKIESNALIAKKLYAGKQLILAKPRTFMNLSGQAVGSLARYYKIETDHILVIYDDVDLEFDITRIKPEGSSSGQKGMNSVIRSLGTNQIPRLRMGIGRPNGRMDTADYVLQRFSREQEEVLPLFIDRAADAVLHWLDCGIDAAMTKYNQTV